MAGSVSESLCVIPVEKDGSGSVIRKHIIYESMHISWSVLGVFVWQKEDEGVRGENMLFTQVILAISIKRKPMKYEVRDKVIIPCCL